MTTSLFSFISIYDRALATCAHLLDKGAEFAVAQGGVADDILGWRLAADMHPLPFQVGVVANFARGFVARAAGIEVPDAVTASDLDLAGLRATIADARAFLATITPAQIDPRGDMPFAFKLGDVMEPTLPAAQWLAGFALTNIQFHTSMVYAILRMKGVAIGKSDLFPTGL